MHAAAGLVDEGQRQVGDRAPDGVRHPHPEEIGGALIQLDDAAVRGPHQHPGPGEVAERLEPGGQRAHPHPLGRRAGRARPGPGLRPPAA